MPTVSVLNTDANLSAKTVVLAEGATTQTGLITFDRDPSAPFAVSASSAVVTNLDADKLDGAEGSTYYHKTTDGVWTSVSFSAGNFTASGSMTWTVESADQVTFRYHKVNKVMTVAFALEATAVGGTPSTDLQITIPGSFTAAAQFNDVFWYKVSTPTRAAGFLQINASGTTIRLLIDNDGSVNWTAGAVSVWGQVQFETTT